MRDNNQHKEEQVRENPVDKSDWGDGPWQTEPDDGQWVDPTTDLDCMIHRGPAGALCGYVGVPRSHPLYGKEYMDVDTLFDVHGSLTYSAACDDEGIICHVPEAGRDGDIWWFGFDCAHAFDFAPGLEANMREMRKRVPSVGRAFLEGEGTFGQKGYRDWEYVKDECADLALALKGMTDA